MLLSVIFSLGLVATIQAQSNGDCVCFTSDGVNIRDTACGNVVGTGNTGACFTATGGVVDCELSGTPYTWWEFDYSGGTAWAANDFMNISPANQCAGPPSSGCSAVQIVSRAEWGARAPTGTTYLPPVGMFQANSCTDSGLRSSFFCADTSAQNNLLANIIAKQFVHHTVGQHCYNQADCEAEVRDTQNFHMDVNGWSDIGYNFLIGEDGRAYEGRGWDVQGAHASSYNNDAIGISMMGDYTSVMPNQAALDALDNLMGCGVENNVNYPYTIHGHRDACATACPGNTLYPYVTALPGYGGALAPCLYDNQPVV